MAFSQCVGPQDIKGQCWTDEESDGENESEQFLYGIQVKHRLLDYITLHLVVWREMSFFIMIGNDSHYFTLKRRYFYTKNTVLVPNEL